MSLAYKVLTAPQMAQLLADGVFRGAPVDLADGYIHLSALPQLAETPRRSTSISRASRTCLSLRSIWRHWAMR